MMEKKRIKTKIGVGSVVKTKVRDMGEKTSEGGIRSKREKVAGCVKAVVERNNLLVQFEYGKKKEMGCVLLSYVCFKEDVCLGMDEPIS